MSASLTRNFSTELATFANKNVVVTTLEGKEIRGMLLGVREDMSLILRGAVSDGKQHHRMFINGTTIAQMVLGEAPFDMNGLRTELERVFKKTGVRFFEDTRTLLVMDRYRVTEEGVEGDSGPVTDRITRIWSSFKEEQEKGIKNV